MRPRSIMSLLSFTVVGCAGLFAMTACHTTKAMPLDRPCEEDNQCGSGYDCYNRVCTPVCTAQEQCTGDRTCYRHRCIQAPHTNAAKNGTTTAATTIPPGDQTTTLDAINAARAQAQPMQPPAIHPTGPIPDVVSGELRAMRRELETIRREQTAILELLKSHQGAAAHTAAVPSQQHAKPTKPTAR